MGLNRSLHNSLRLMFALIFILSSVPAYSIAPRSQADGKFLYEFDVQNFIKDGFYLYTEPGRDQVLVFFLGEIAEPSSDYHYYVIDVFDLASRQRIGFIDFSTLTNRESGKTSTSFVTALEWVKTRTYRDASLKAAAEYGLQLGNTDQGVQEALEFRRTAPVDPPPAIYIKKEFQKTGKLGWKHIGDILVCFMIETSIRSNSQYIGIDPEQGLAHRNFYERRYGALRKKGWYLELLPSAFAKLRQVALDGMVFDFENGLFRPQAAGEVLPDAADVFIESLLPFDEAQASRIDKDTQRNLFPDRHVWSLIKGLSELAGENHHSRMHGWILEAFQARGKRPIMIPLALEKIPESWRPAVLIAQEKGLIQFSDLSARLQVLPLTGAETLTERASFSIVDRAA